jgi:hypothetical protein
MHMAACPQTLGVPPPPQVSGAAQAPQLRRLPQPSPAGPHSTPRSAHVFGMQMGPPQTLGL